MKLHQDFEGVSVGTVVYLTIKPASWASGAAFNYSLYGALTTDSSMGLGELDADGAGITSLFTSETGSSGTAHTAGTIDRAGKVDWASSNEDGIVVSWLCTPAPTHRYPVSGTLDDDGNTIPSSAGDASETGLGFALSWNVSSGSTA